MLRRIAKLISQDAKRPKRAVPGQATPKVEALEQRVLFSADLPWVVAEPSTTDAFDQYSEQSVDQSGESLTSESAYVQQSLVIIDRSVIEREQLSAEEAMAQFWASGVNATLLDSSISGLLQLNDAMAQSESIGSFSIVTTATSEGLLLGDSAVGVNDLLNQTNEISAWRDSLSADASFDIYATSLAEYPDYAHYAALLGMMTGASVDIASFESFDSVTTEIVDYAVSAGLVLTPEESEASPDGQTSPQYAVSTGLLLAAEDSSPSTDGQASVEYAVSTGLVLAPSEQVSVELVFVDSRVEDYETLIADIDARDGADRVYDVVLLNAEQDGIDQISAVLAQYEGVDGVHLLSHGSADGVSLGATWLTSENIDDYFGAIEGWASSLDADADILIYGCDLASSDQGVALLTRLQTLTGADVAASTDPTGDADLGGDWDLEYEAGAIEAAIAVSAEAQALFDGLLATPDIVVDSASIAPTITLPGGPVNYSENDPATVIDSTATVSDPDSGDFDGGTLTIDFAANGTTNDRLAIRNQGPGIGTIEISGNNITYNSGGPSMLIGTFTGGTDGSTPLVITFNAAADATAVQALLRNITYENASENPSTATRTVRFVMTDGDGGTSSAETEVINVAAVNDDPTNAGTMPMDLVFLQDTQGKLDLSAIDLSDVDANGGNLTLTITSDAGHLQTLGWPGLSLSGSQSQLSLTGSLADLNAFLNDANSIDYEHATPGMYGNDVDLITIEISDNGNTGSGGGGTITLGTINIDIDPVAPQIDLDADDSAATGSDFSTTWTQGGGQIAIVDTDASIVDADSTYLQSLTITLTNHLDGADERMVADASGTNISVTYAQGPGEYYVYLTGTDTIANYENVLKSVVYDNTAVSPSTANRIVTVEASDGTNVSNIATTTISISGVNVAPTLTLPGASIDYEEGNGAVVIDATATVSDSDSGDFDGGTLTIDFAAGGTANDRLSILSTGSGQGQISISGNQISHEGTVIGTFTGGTDGTTPLVITFNMNADEPPVQDLLRHITYENVSESPSTATRTVRFVMTDGDGGTSAAVTQTIDVTSLNDDPVNTGSVPTDVSVVEDTPGFIDLSTISFQDVDAGSNLIQVTLSTSNGGVLTASSDFDVMVFGSGTGNLTLRGGVSDLNNFFSSAFRFQYSSSTTHLAGDNADTISITVNDLGNTGDGGGLNVDFGTVNVDITPKNDAPVLTAGAVNNLTVNEDSGLTSLGLTGVTYGSGGGADESGQTLSYEVSVIPAPTSGDIFLADDTTRVTLGSYTLEQIRGMQFRPADNWNGTTGFEFRVTDSGGTANGGTDSISQFMLITVDPVNDDPINAGTLPTDLVFLQDTQSKLDLSAIDLSDVDANGGNLTLTITSDAGHLQTMGWPGLTLGGSQTQLILTGSLADLNAFLNDANSIDYEHATPGMYGNDVDLITIEISDNGNTGSGGGGTISLGTINIDIEPVAPQIDLDADDSAATGNNYITTWTQADGQINVVDTDATIVDADSTHLQSMTITLTNHLDGADERMIADVSGTNISVTYGQGPGEYYVYLTGADTIENYESVLKSVVYDNTAASPSTAPRLITVEASDGTNISNIATTTINVNDVNDAPALSGANDLTAIAEDDTNNAGTLVSDLIAGHVNDPDAGALSGIAVVAVDDTDGMWEYSIDGGSTWTAFGAVDGASARLLAADANTYVRFVPDANFNGTVTNGITFHAWDQTSGTSGGTADLTTTYTIRDEFTTAAFNNNDGTASWAGDWVEYDDAGGAASGNVRVENGKLRIDNLDGGSFDAATRAFDLSGATSATLTIDYDGIREGVVGGDRFTIEVSNDGGATWTLLEEITAPGETTANTQFSGNVSYDLDSSLALTGDMVLRLSISAGFGGTNQCVNFDNVQVEYSAVAATGGTTAFSTATASSSIAIANVNDTPSGTVTIDNMSPSQGDVLAASNTLTDPDGLSGPITYQWYRDGVAIGGATGTTYTTTQSDVGGVITVVASYTDDQGTAESVSSAGTAAVTNVNEAPSGVVSIDNMSPAQGDTLTASNTLTDPDGLSGPISYQWYRDGVAITGATGTTYTTTQSDVGAVITVVASYTDDQGTAESVASAGTAAVTNVNEAPSGVVSIDNMSPAQGDVLAASNTLTDPDGLSGPITYQWYRDGVAIGGATGATYTTTQSDVGGVITVVASYTDDQGTAESVSSAGTAAVGNVNDAPSGVVSIDNMNPSQGDTLTASNTLTDPDGLSGPISYQWYRDGVAITGATATTYTTTQSDVGAVITVVASYTDDLGTAESVGSAGTAAVTNVNEAPSGVVSIDNMSPSQGDVLAASNTLTDPDGLSGPITYQWYRDGVAIGGATGTTYTTTQSDVGGVITVVASYTDDQGTAESVSSAGTAAVTNVNEAPSGVVSIDNMSPAQGDTLTASNTLTDPDGLSGPISYQWYRDGVAITGATGTTYTTTQSDVGAVITVVASYTDDQGTAESVASAGTAAVTNVNEAPSGVVSIDNMSPAQGDVLAASNTLTDPDGLSGPITYQWYRDGVAIGGATGATYTTTQSDVGGVITVVASYTDDQGTAESVSSAGTAAVGNVNDAPSGVVSIDNMNPSQGDTLTASNTLTDPDGLSGPISYQWYRDGVAITGATATTYTTTQSDVGAVITVVASYTDDLGTAESVGSAGTAAVTNVNEAPSGVVSIDNMSPSQGDVLAASNTLTDPDGLSGPITYQWYRDGVAIGGATGTTYTTTQSDVGGVITVVASYTDDQGTAESVSSAGTAAVTNVNEAPSGVVSIDNMSPAQGDTLTASNTLTDPDGLSGPISYQWYRDGVAITGATATTYTTTQSDVGAVITVVASYTDDLGTAESVGSAGTAAVTNVNEAPSGVVSIDNMSPSQGDVLAASNTLTDPDGLSGPITYQWYRDGVAIGGATGTTYTTTQSDVGGVITVVASYTDDLGTAESVSSAGTAAVTNVNDAPSGTVTIDNTTPAQGDTLTASNTLTDPDGLSGPISYQWYRDGVAIGGATGTTYTTTQSDVGGVITVVASYTDDLGTAESVSSAGTAAVTNVNDAPSGTVTIDNTTPAQGDTLTASNTLTDPDGLSGPSSYQWYRDGVAIAGATGTTYTTTQSDVGGVITVVASYTDDQGTAESVSSAGTAGVTNVNDAPSGVVSIDNMNPSQGDTLTASNTLTDPDGLSGPISYQWYRDGVAITGATGTTYTTTQGDVGGVITVVASYTDDLGTAESVSSAGTAAVTNVNDAPSGTVTIDNMSPAQGDTLTASNTLTDPDGLSGPISYQWYRDGVAITGATATTYTTTQSDVGAVITVVASYTDDLGTAESVSSAGTAAVTNVNEAPSGVVSIDNMSPAQGDTLTASNTLSDPDGLSGPISYQWYRDGVAIGGATGATYTTTQSDVGAVITVVASYTDDQGTAESVSSAGTAAVTNVNDAPSGVVSIDNMSPAQGDTLTASNTLTDPDGLSGPISYQWYRDGVAIGGATGATYTTAQSDVGAVITVVASYTDDQGTAESVSSAGTAAVTNVNDAPSGVVSIDNMSPAQGDTLTASNTLTDPDGLSGPISYQWYRDGVAITGATGTTYTTTQSDVGAVITVVASYTDDLGTAESVGSAGTAAVTNVNEAPSGVVSIDNMSPAQGDVLTASNTLTDPDGLSGPITYQWYRDGVAIGGATGATYTTTQSDVGGVITVVASYTDDQGTAESVSSAGTAAVGNVNDAPSGVVSIDNMNPSQGDTLTASNTLTDPDGLSGPISYQWYRDGVAITGATATTYTTTQSDVGAVITVVASYTDDLGTAESVGSAGTAAVTNVNEAPSGVVSIDNMSPSQGDVLAASNTLTDPDGLSGPITYQWYRDGVAIGGATGATYTTTQADVGGVITVVASYTDDLGTAESVSSAGTAAVTNVNDAPSGVVSIDNMSPAQGDTLTASNTLTDPDGLSGPISYQWYRDGVAIGGATGTTYTTTQSDVGGVITVVASYTDDLGTAESVSSAGTAAVTNVNDAPSGTVTIDNTTPAQGDTLTASNTLTDPDGLSGPSSYQWYRDGVAIAGATGTTYTTTQSDVGGVITVVASYTDDQGTAESVSSAGTAGVTNVNDAPSGVVSIDNMTPAQGDVLTASNTLTDPDGLSGPISYQWYRDGVAIGGATGSTYTTTQSDVGAVITVVASYTDDLGTAESVGSAGTAAVTNVNEAPSGVVSIDNMTPAQGDTLTASNTLSDPDGLSGPISYQWYRDGVAIGGATGATYTTTQSDVGGVITVVASYTDDQGTAESVSSAGTAAVTNVNDAPSGVVSIDNMSPAQGDTLTASNTLTDPDGLSGPISYQWYRDGVAIGGATGATYTTTQADVGGVITVVASYTDDQGTAESVSSAGTAAVTNVNDAPSGVVSIDNMNPSQGDTLTASNTLTDPDGLSGPISYQWYRDGVAIGGATGATYTTTQADVGGVITVVASYTDDQGTAESVSSAGTAAVTNVNDAPSGVVSIDNMNPSQGDTLTASNTLTDPDGLSGPISYQWYRDGVAIGGATGATYTTTQADVGGVITVVASYTDDQGTAESVSSAGTAAVTNVNDAPSGVVSIDNMTPAQGDTLTASNTLTDPDGLSGPITYQWYRDGVAITGATGSMYATTPSDVGAVITVVASYTDDLGTAESVSSAGTAAVQSAAIAQNDSLTTAEDMPLVIDVMRDLLANDTGIDGSALISVSLSQPANGFVSENPDGTWTYLPDIDFNGTDTLTYEAVDLYGNRVTGNIMINVTPVNDAPTFLSGPDLQASEGDAASFSILADDVDGDALSYSISGGSDAQLMRIDPVTGQLSFVSEPDFEAPTDSDADNTYEVVVTVEDTNGGRRDMSLQVQIADVNEAPIANDGIFSIGAGDSSVIIGQVLATDPDANDALAYEIVSGNGLEFFDVDPDTGGIVNTNGATPAGAYEFEVEITDTSGMATSATVQILVEPATTPQDETDDSDPGDADSGIPEPAAESPDSTDADGVADTEESDVVADGDAEGIETVAAEPAVDASVDSNYEPRIYEVPVADEQKGMADRPTLSLRLRIAFENPEFELDGIQVEDEEQAMALVSALALQVPSELVAALDDLAFDLSADETFEFQTTGAVVASVSLSAGFVVWVLRAGSLLASLLTTKPIWTELDPLPIFSGDDEDRDGDHVSLLKKTEHLNGN